MKNNKRTLKAIDYSINIGYGMDDEISVLLNSGKYKKCKPYILVDENTKLHCLPLLQGKVSGLKDAEVIEIRSGEEHKTLETAKYIWTELIQRGAFRDSIIVNLGGGVISDLGGFAASTFKRGIPYINIPTTLLAQVDASIGGKTAIDFNDLKNQIGLFSNPVEVFVNPAYLSTLPERHLCSGFAEIIKHALIRDKTYWNIVTKYQVSDIRYKYKAYQTLIFERISNWEEIIYKSIIIKNDIVKADPYDNKMRKKLNFGHTIGHAIESLSIQNDTEPLLHGEAIAIGMICESYLSSIKTGLPDIELEEITGYINSLFPHYKLRKKDYDELVMLMLSDKKNKPKGINFTLLKHIGSSQINKYCTPNEIFSSLDYYKSAFSL